MNHPQRGKFGERRNSTASVAKAVEKGGAITRETLDKLLDLLATETEYPHHIEVAVTTGGLVKTLDNERDALETVRRLEARRDNRTASAREGRPMTPPAELVAVDPGLLKSGFAVFVHGKLVAAGVVRVPAKAGGLLKRSSIMGQRIVFEARRFATGGRLIVEWPQVYDARDASKTKKQNANSVIPLAAVCGAVSQAFEDCDEVTPHDWKGNTPKPKKVEDPYIVTGRVQKRLEPAERAAVASLPDKEWDAWDAVGLGLWALGRWEQDFFPGAT